MANEVDPFLKWAGSKRGLVNALSEFVPKSYEKYFEPFLGSGSVFFSIKTHLPAFLSDTIPALTGCFAAVKSDPKAVYQALVQWPVNRDSYYDVRSYSPVNDVEAAARFIYLNKTAFNGLYRVNKSGGFNVPFGRPKSGHIASEDQLVAASLALENAAISTHDFDDALRTASTNDFVYLDPPYVAGHRKNGFIDYNARLFTWDDQLRLENRFRELDTKGALVLLSNADHYTIRELYDDFTTIGIERYSSMSARSSARGKTQEIVVLGNSLKKSLEWSET